MLEDLFKRYPAREETVKTALIRLLTTENARMKSARSYTEEYGNYFGDLLGTIGALHDRRAIDTLLDNLGTGDMATKALAGFGKDSLDRVLMRMDDSSLLIRQSATITLSEMLDPSVHAPLDSAAIGRIKAALLSALRDKSFFVQIAAIEGLTLLPGDDVTAVLKTVAADDPFHRPTVDGRGISYPVREAAQKALSLRSGRSGRSLPRS
jgi:HEAT repeat protein